MVGGRLAGSVKGKKVKRIFYWERGATHRWGPMLGCDEYGNRTFGLLSPLGSVFFCLNLKLRNKLDWELDNPDSLG